MGDDVGDNDGTSRTPLISLPCPTLRYPSALICLSFSILYGEIMHTSFESIQRAMRIDQPKTPEPMRGTLLNTDQTRMPHSEYHHTWRRRQEAL